MGTAVGVLLNQIFPGWLIEFLLVALLLAMIYSVFRNVCHRLLMLPMFPFSLNACSSYVCICWNIRAVLCKIFSLPKSCLPFCIIFSCTIDLLHAVNSDPNDDKVVEQPSRLHGLPHILRQELSHVRILSIS